MGHALTLAEFTKRRHAAAVVSLGGHEQYPRGCYSRLEVSARSKPAAGDRGSVCWGAYGAKEEEHVMCARMVPNNPFM